MATIGEHIASAAAAKCRLCAQDVPHRKYGMPPRILWEMHDLPTPVGLFVPCAASEIWLAFYGAVPDIVQG